MDLEAIAARAGIDPGRIVEVSDVTSNPPALEGALQHFDRVRDSPWIVLFTGVSKLVFPTFTGMLDFETRASGIVTVQTCAGERSGILVKGGSGDEAMRLVDSPKTGNYILNCTVADARTTEILIQGREDKKAIITPDSEGEAYVLQIVRPSFLPFQAFTDLVRVVSTTYELDFVPLSGLSVRARVPYGNYLTIGQATDFTIGKANDHYFVHVEFCRSIGKNKINDAFAEYNLPIKYDQAQGQGMIPTSVRTVREFAVYPHYTKVAECVGLLLGLVPQPKLQELPLFGIKNEL